MTSSTPLAIVTGAGSSLGRLITLELASVGVAVLMVGRNRVALERTASEVEQRGAVHPHLCPCDLERADAPAHILAAAEAAGGADILVNNAAIQGPIGPAWEIDATEFARTLQVDFLAPVMLMRAVVPGMIARGAGWIVNISGGGATGPRPMVSAYGAAKTALVRFGETLAAEVRDKGVRVNSIAPGAFASGMTQAILANADRVGQQEAAGARKLVDNGDDAAAVKASRLVAYLAAGPGRDITGKLISAVWDPWSELHTRWDEIGGKDIYTLRRIVPRDRQLEWG